jgi:hypothetical protein
MTKIECTHCEKAHTTTQYISTGVRGVLSRSEPNTLRRFIADNNLPPIEWVASGESASLTFTRSRRAPTGIGDDLN